MFLYGKTEGLDVWFSVQYVSEICYSVRIIGNIEPLHDYITLIRNN